MNKINYFFLLSLLVISPTIYAKTIQIDFTPYETYSIEVAHIDVGDTIEWLPKFEGHNVQFLAGPNMNSLQKLYWEFRLPLSRSTPLSSTTNIFYSI